MMKDMLFSVSIPNSETIMAIEAAYREEGLEKVTLEQLRQQFNDERRKLLNRHKKSKKVK